jgi:5-amino-6-(5-phosphoribosylamino)uracil reductase
MGDRPYTLLSCSVSLDGYLDRAGGDRLVLSNAADLDRVDEVRAGCDAIMVGAATIRRDDPRLLVRSESRRTRRTALGLPPSPTKVTVTERADLDADAAFFTCGTSEPLVYCATPKADDAVTRLGRRATVVDAGHPVDLRWVLGDLASRGVRRLMVEGGGTVHTQLLTAGLADELQLVVAPLFVGDSRAVRFVGDGSFPWRDGQRARLVDTRPVGDVVLLRYALSERYDAAGVLS